MLQKIIQDFLVLWATIDPIGTLALFTAITGHLNAAERRRVARQATIYAGIVLVVAVVVGQAVLAGMGIRLLSLQVAGGIILFLFALKMVFRRMETLGGHPEEGYNIAVFPLAIPSIATPGAIMAAILLTDNNAHTIPQQIETTIVLVVILAITYVFMLLSDKILDIIGKNGAQILVKVMGMLLAALSVELIMKAIGIEQWLQAAT